jgi:hypothetical protein
MRILLLTATLSVARLYHMNKSLMMFLAACVFLIAAFVGTTVLSRSVRASMAERSGADFIKELYSEYTIAGQSCQGEDTDGDKYVSCDFRIKNPANEERVVHLQCPVIYKGLLGSTCKESRMVVAPQ